ncbi:tetratricopeptide repeat protein [Maribellus sediminis]|uniref:tetratricopeptide repeat protein n=1 Tax=Maribellus sediminis TaxID=2696285 RepID=UPI00142FD68F|nr:tetratricopeptide repeat protein [Maribellus sediminis]
MSGKIYSILLLLIFPLMAQTQNHIDQLILNKEYDKALVAINNEAASHPSAGLFLKKGLVYKNLQDYQNAVAAYTEGLGYEPNNVNLLEETAESFSVLGNNQDAISFYKKAVELDTTNLALAGKLGRVYINLKLYKPAYQVFSSIYAKDSSNVYWNKQLAYCAFRVFEREEAVHLYEKVIDANPRDHGSYINLINCYNWKKEGNEIMMAIQKGLKEFPADPELLYEEAMYFYKSKRYGPAMVQFEKYLDAEEMPEYETIMNYGIAAYFAGFEEKALEIFGDLYNQNPNDPLVMYYQSLCYKKLKDFEQSEKLMKWAIEGSTPDYVSEMYHHLGQIYGQKRKFKESVEALEKAYQMNPDKVEVLFEIATTYEEFNSNKTLAMNYYRIYLQEAGEAGKNTEYALTRIEKLKEDLFFDE